MKAPVVALKQPGNHGPTRRINLQENLSTTAATRQIRLLRTARKLQPIRGLGVLHGRRAPGGSRRRNSSRAWKLGCGSNARSESGTGRTEIAKLRERGANARMS